MLKFLIQQQETLYLNAFIHSAYTMCILQPIWIENTQNTQKKRTCIIFVQWHSEHLNAYAHVNVT